MSSVEHWRRVSAIFHAATDAPAPEREKILSELCGADAALKAEIDALLSAHESPTRFLDQSPDDLFGARLQPGTVLCDRFVIVRPLGAGGMGEVWAARDQQLNEEVAIKTILSPFTAVEDRLARFKREIQLARRIAHPNVCRVHDLFEDVSGPRSRFFLTMELIEGETLATRLKRDGPVPVQAALAIVQQIIFGLSAAHAANVVHRDLKPSNVMLTTTPGRPVVIMDFGLARLFDAASSHDATRTAVTTVAGTHAYMAPEQISGAMATAQTDIYALGLMMFEMLRGERPFGGTDALDSWMRRARETPVKLTGLVLGVDHRIDDVIARCLEYERAKRFGSVEEVWAALQRRHMPFLPHRPAARAAAFAGIAAAGVLLWQLAVWSRQPNPPQEEVIRWYTEAGQELAEGSSVRALNSINRALDAVPDFMVARARLAEIQLELDMRGRAQETMLLASASALPAASSESDYISGMRELLLRNCDGAVRSLTRYGQSGPVAERPYRLLSTVRAMERCGLTDDAQTVLAQAAALDPRNAAVRLRQARLFARGRDWPAAMTALDTADRLFRERNNFEGVCEVLVARGTFQEQQDALDLATATLTKAKDIAQSLDDLRQQIRVRIQLAIVNRKRGDVAAAERLTGEAIDLARRQNLETLTLDGLFAQGNVHMVRNQYREAEPLFERAFTIAETHRDEEYRARAWLALATVYVRVMEPDKAEKAVVAARPYFERTKQARNLLIVDMLLGQVRIQRAEYSVAASDLEVAAARAVEHKDLDLEGTARQYLATALTGMGRYADALEQYRRVLQGRRGAGRERSESLALLNVADTLSMMGRFSEAAATLREAETLVQTIVPVPGEIQSQVFFVRAAHALREGRYEAAWVDAGKARDFGVGLSTERETRAHLLTCAAGAVLGRAAQAEASCAAARRASRVETLAPLWLETQLVDAETRVRLGKSAGVEAFLSDALRVVDKSAPSGDKWRVLSLAAAVSAEGQGEKRASLTRELDALRMLWGEAAYRDWARRSDVRSLLVLAGIPKGDSHVFP